jgi:hypothetical protein
MQCEVTIYLNGLTNLQTKKNKFKQIVNGCGKTLPGFLRNERLVHPGHPSIIPWACLMDIRGGGTV